MVFSNPSGGPGAAKPQTDSHSRTRLALTEAQDQLMLAEREKEALAEELRAIRASSSWRLTRPLRAAKYLWLARKALWPPSVWGMRARQVRHIYREQGLKGLRQLFRQAGRLSQADYLVWVKRYDTLTTQDREAIRRHISGFAARPLISILMPVYNVEERWLKAALDSVLRQLYPHWELCIADDASTMPHIRRVLEAYQREDKRIKVRFRDTNGHISEASNTALAMARGTFVALLDHDDLLAEHALYHVAARLDAQPELDLLYSDSDMIDTEGVRYGPYFKSDWNPELFLTHNMICHLGVYRRLLVERIGGFRNGFEGAQDYDLALRFLRETTEARITHIPHILYHWRAIEGSTAQGIEHKPYAVATARKAVREYVQSLDPKAEVTDPVGLGRTLGYHRVIYAVPDPAPEVDILIPTRDNVELLRTCIESIHAHTDYPRYRITVIDNQSARPETKTHLEQGALAGDFSVLPYPHPFNFSAINNFAVERTNGDLVLFLNNDTEVINDGWLREMVAQIMRPHIGAVGAKLYFQDRTIQHAGVLLGCGVQTYPVAGHQFIGRPASYEGPVCRARSVQRLSAVTGACLLVRRTAFHQVGGFDAEHLKVAFNDIDLCLKLGAAGWHTVWTPYAELYHYESRSRGYETSPEKQARFTEESRLMRERWGTLIDLDPYYNPNLDLKRWDYELAYPPRVLPPWKSTQTRKASTDVPQSDAATRDTASV